MPQPLEASFPQLLDLPDGYVIRLDAVDPTTGAHVGGVNVESVSIFATNLSGLAPGEINDLTLGPWTLVYSPAG